MSINQKLLDKQKGKAPEKQTQDWFVRFPRGDQFVLFRAFEDEGDGLIPVRVEIEEEGRVVSRYRGVLALSYVWRPLDGPAVDPESD